MEGSFLEIQDSHVCRVSFRRKKKDGTPAKEEAKTATKSGTTVS